MADLSNEQIDIALQNLREGKSLYIVSSLVLEDFSPQDIRKAIVENRGVEELRNARKEGASKPEFLLNSIISIKELAKKDKTMTKDKMGSIIDLLQDAVVDLAAFMDDLEN
jgi:hypothetical protein